MAKEYIVPVTWEMCGFVKVVAESAEEAMANIANNDDSPIPDDSVYVDGSYHLSSDDVELIEMYTEAYEQGNLGSVPETCKDE